MVLPTGSGKTFTAVRFLCQGPLSEGYKVLWLAHTHHLLEQAFFSFIPEDRENEGYEVGWIREPREDIKIRVVSGSTNNFKVDQIKKTDDIVIATTQTITNAYKKKHPQLEEFLKSADGKLFIVFDEAHHVPAPSNRKLIIGDNSLEIRKSLRERFPKMYILGLTATPTYSDEEKRGWLKEIFPQEIVYQAEIKNLIFEKILAKPNIIESKTHIKQEFNEREYIKLVRDYEKDIPIKMIERLAENKNRNQFIVDSYVKNKKKYGKTIIFADRLEQCEYLNKLLKNNHIQSDVIYSASGRDKDNINALEKFKNNEIDVIVNIRMLTEGTDVPDVNSVFLTRQTTSQILLTQMVGRALRGPKFGGSEEANLVFFIDNWKQQINWAMWDPRIWGVKKGPDKIIDTPPWDLISIQLIQDLIERISDGEHIAGSFSSSMPIGWYQVDFFKSNEDNDSDDSEGKIRELVMVFEDSFDHYKNLIKYLQKRNFEKFDNEKITLEDCEEEINSFNDRFFAPKEEQIDRDILRNIFRIALHIAQDKDNNPPKFFEFNDREKYDLDAIAKEYIDADYGPHTVNDKLKKLYEDKTQIWGTLYYNFNLFKSQYYSSVEWILNPPEPHKPLLSKEENLVKTLATGNPEQKIEACHELANIAVNEAIHDNTLDLIIKTSQNDSNKEVRKNAKISVDKILSLELSQKDKNRIKKRDGYKCLCCGESSRHKLQVDHINPRFYGTNNSDDNLQTLCSVCNGSKGTETIDFRLKKTPLSKPPKKFSYIKEMEVAKRRQIIDTDWWKKLITRKVNLFYHCDAVKSIKIIGDQKLFENIRITINKGNDPSWVAPELKKMIPHMQYERQFYYMHGPSKIEVTD